MSKQKVKEPIYAIRAYCRKCGKFIMESKRVTKKQLIASWDDAVFKACGIYCMDCKTKPPVINDLRIYNYALNKELKPEYVLPKPNFDLLEDAKQKLGI